MFGITKLLVFVLSAVSTRALFPVNILHYNDFHARFVETNAAGRACDPNAGPCVAGFARLATLVRERMAAEPDSLLLNGGDSFQGTIWYNILRWNVTQDFMNMLPHTVHVLGNHEFDNGIEGVVPYLKHLNAPVVTANIIDDNEPSMQGLYNHSIIVERGGRKIGIIGVILSITNQIAVTGRLQFTDEIETVKAESQKLHDQGINMIIVLSHCGIDLDIEIAKHGGPHIDVIVGGHTHTLLFNGDPVPNSPFVPQGPYPLIVEGENTVLVVQAAAHSRFLGEIKVYFDDDGNVVNWYGNPHHVGNEIEQAPDVIAKINAYLPVIEEQVSVEVGTSLVLLDSNCRCAECNLGNFICDALMHAVIDRAEGNNWHYAHFAVMNRGGIRADISAGVITLESVLLTLPFENSVEVFELRGDHIMEMLEYGVANIPFPGARMLQFSGLYATFDGARPVNNRVLNVTIRCIECEVPRYEPLQLDKFYKVVTHSFLGEGGDGFTMVSENRKNVEVVGVDYDVLLQYIRKESPIVAEVEGRIHIDNACLP